MDKKLELGSNLQDKRTEAELNKEVEDAKRNNDEQKTRTKKAPSKKSGETSSRSSNRVLRSQTSNNSAQTSSKGSAPEIDELAPQ